MTEPDAIEGGEDMSRKLETDIKFSQNWGGKLDMDRFTTFRGQDKLYKIGQQYPVTLISGVYHTKKDYGFAQLLEIEFKRVVDITITEIIVDIGRRTSADPRRYFFNLMKDFYKFKKWWDGVNTIMQKLTFEKIGRGSRVGG